MSVDGHVNLFRLQIITIAIGIYINNYYICSHHQSVDGEIKMPIFGSAPEEHAHNNYGHGHGHVVAHPMNL